MALAGASHDCCVEEERTERVRIRANVEADSPGCAEGAATCHEREGSSLTSSDCHTPRGAPPTISSGEFSGRTCE